ncbi:hypothetical protein LCGC14_2218660 [marine sediment metagenome]|uniref:Uncharacterized protein n=1 Tax=marine sediment metagenome TaxID=412755 RepID=A0A0F9FP76_9ZZZZ
MTSGVYKRTEKQKKEWLRKRAERKEMEEAIQDVIEEENNNKKG